MHKIEHPLPVADLRGTENRPLVVKLISSPEEKPTFDHALLCGQIFLTAAIGMATIYIAAQQHKTNRQKLILDHYDKRFRIKQP